MFVYQLQLKDSQVVLIDIDAYLPRDVQKDFSLV